MIRPFTSLTAIVATLGVCALPGLSSAQTAGDGQGQPGGPLALEFLPTTFGPRDICNAPPVDDGIDDLDVEGEDEELTDEDRILYLTRDIRRHMADDADRWFDFIDALITRRAALDAEFAGIDALLARIDLHLRADRLEALRDAGLVQRLRGLMEEMTNNQKLVLAQYYRTGTGTAPDPGFAETLIREAAFGGNARALLEIARMQINGEALTDWDAPLDLTVTMAFGGILGELTPGVCARAERIAQEYLKGDVVQRNPAIALQWRKFAADLGSAEAAWQVVEYHLNAEADRKDNAEMMLYLRRAADLGLSLDSRQSSRIVSSGAVTAEELADMLGFNRSQDPRRAEASLIPHLELVVNVDGLEADEDGLYLDYLREIATMPEAPGFVFTELADEVMTRRGRWAAEDEGRALLEEAVRRGDEEGMQRLARLLIRYRDDPRQINRAENLLFETIDRFGMVSSMAVLDGLYRCQVNDAPRLEEARHWAAAYRATHHALVPISATDLIALDPFKDPETIALIQSQALDGRTQAMADQAQRVQSAGLSPEEALRYWAGRINRSDQALEAFAELEFELATNPAERALAVEFFRRVYLNNGVTTALDLAIALLEDAGRDPDVAEEILHLLTMAGNRGEGAAIRLKSRVLAEDLTADAYAESARRTYAEFADVIEARGDFLALIFAIPFLPPERVDDYVDRAVSLMNCGTKDADELGDAYAIRMDPQLSYHWRRVGLEMEGGHVLSKLRLSNAQMQWFDKGRAPDMAGLETRALEDGETGAHRRLYVLTADADLPSYDPEAAAMHYQAGLGAGARGDLLWATQALRRADAPVRAAIAARVPLRALYQSAVQTGDAASRFEYAMLLREQVSAPVDLVESVRWLTAAAEAGHDEAMVELGYALGLGLGVARDVPTALDWLDRAEAAGHPRAAGLDALVRATAGL
ncbi:hypothetical protein [Cognatishimia sp. F0-27]|uniref:tetratricopeptide repeat protein n=1 Tax=Cognatishimia sp. F0-27 TaxID=2816855 RepID=UPI001D0C8C3A|nr:hypothetical protein [Cognatishimia sp. F0-27]MCC1494905.1 sel1 repeat family protein [Cognatishimia sp. F0-27]